MITFRYFLYVLSFVAMSSILGCSNQYKENIQAANNGDAIAQYEVGMAYLEGKGIDKNADHALTWFKKSSDLGFKKADIAYAETFFSKNMELAEKGDAEGQYRVALALLQGYGVKKDDGEALDWFTKAAKQNHGNAVMALSKIIGVSNSVTHINNSADRYKNDQERFNAITVSDKPKIFEPKEKPLPILRLPGSEQNQGGVSKFFVQQHFYIAEQLFYCKRSKPGFFDFSIHRRRNSSTAFRSISCMVASGQMSAEKSSPTSAKMARSLSSGI